MYYLRLSEYLLVFFDSNMSDSNKVGFYPIMNVHEGVEGLTGAL